jgi:hypothetical protein
MDIYELESESEYEVIQDILDYYGQSFLTGRRLIYVRRHYLPNDDGHTVVFLQEREFMPGSFREIVMYLQGTNQRDIIDNTDKYLHPIILES